MIHFRMWYVYIKYRDPAENTLSCTQHVQLVLEAGVASHHTMIIYFFVLAVLPSRRWFSIVLAQGFSKNVGMAVTDADQAI